MTATYLAWILLRINHCTFGS